MEILIFIALGYLVVLNIIGFAVMGIDKRKSVRKAWRIPERNLILIAFLGGGIGSFLGMRVFRHKTKHMKFIILIPISAVLYLYLGYLLISSIVNSFK